MTKTLRNSFLLSILYIGLIRLRPIWERYPGGFWSMLFFLAISGDSKYSHKRFHETEPILKDLVLTIGADNNQEVSRAFGVLVEEEGVALRGRFLFTPDGLCVAQEVQADSVGRNVNEFLRQVQAWQHATEHNVVCPAGWRPGKKTLPVAANPEKMTGRVGDYITIEEILS